VGSPAGGRQVSSLSSGRKRAPDCRSFPMRLATRPGFSVPQKNHPNLGHIPGTVKSASIPDGESGQGISPALTRAAGPATSHWTTRSFHAGSVGLHVRRLQVGLAVPPRSPTSPPRPPHSPAAAPEPAMPVGKSTAAPLLDAAGLRPDQRHTLRNSARNASRRPSASSIVAMNVNHRPCLFSDAPAPPFRRWRGRTRAYFFSTTQMLRLLQRVAVALQPERARACLFLLHCGRRPSGR